MNVCFVAIRKIIGDIKVAEIDFLVILPHSNKWEMRDLTYFIKIVCDHEK